MGTASRGVGAIRLWARAPGSSSRSRSQSPGAWLWTSQWRWGRAHLLLGLQAGVVVEPVPLLGHLEGRVLLAHSLAALNLPVVEDDEDPDDRTYIQGDKLLPLRRPAAKGAAQSHSQGLAAPTQGQDVGVLHHLICFHQVLLVFFWFQFDRILWFFWEPLEAFSLGISFCV